VLYDTAVSDESAKTEVHEPFGWQIVWALMQLGALGLSAARIPLSARYPATGEQWALHVTLVMQVGLSAMIFPRLLSAWWRTWCAIGIAWVFAELAAFLADCPFANAAGAEGFVTFWIFTLAIWRWAIPNGRAMLFAAALATAISFGGVGVSYLLHEFGSQELGINWRREGMLGPIMGALSAASTEFHWTAVIPIASFLILGIAARIIWKRCASMK
jgi:hypothetical protein